MSGIWFGVKTYRVHRLESSIKVEEPNKHIHKNGVLGRNGWG